MNFYVNPRKVLGKRSPMIYGHFIEHFHRQIYGGVYDPGSPFADEDGFREDVLEALRKIKIPVLRWPGGCFVSSYDWKKGIGKKRTPVFDKAWRVEEPNTFGTDEFIKLCRKLECEPYICTNAGTGTAEEMSDWVEYCNLENEGMWAKERIANGYIRPHKVKYWSIGNENYGSWELGAKSHKEWGRFVLEAAKMMKRVDPTIELSAAALPDIDWNIELLKNASDFLSWISIHEYWDRIHQTNELATYEQVMAYTLRLNNSIERVKGILTAMGLKDKIKIAFDEWNLRGWYHPNIHTIEQGKTKDEYLTPRDDNDINSSYTMADAVFSACFLNTCNRYCDVIGMANYAPVVNTRGVIYTYDKGIVKRTTYYVFDLYVNYLGDTIIDSWEIGNDPFQVTAKDGQKLNVNSLDVLPTLDTQRNRLAIAVVNKHPDQSKKIKIKIEDTKIYEKCEMYTLAGKDKDSYNDIDREDAVIVHTPCHIELGREINATIPPHSVNVIVATP